MQAAPGQGTQLGGHQARAAQRGRQTLIYLHLPKCGGTTLNRLIEWEYPPWRIYSIDPSFFRWSYYRLIRWRPERLARLEVIKGHMPFGIHRRLAQPATYVTVLREPVERVISEYYFARHYRLHPQHRRMQGLTLEQYATTTPHHNLQCKLLAGLPGPRDFLAGDCTEETLGVAKANLAKHFTLAGLTERFDETLALLKILFHWKLEKMASFNITRTRPKKDRVPDSIQQLIADRNRFDVAIYAHAVAQFEQVMHVHREAVTAELSQITRAKGLSGMEKACYQAASSVRKMTSRVYSAL